MKEFIQPVWWFAGMLLPTVIFELLNGSFKQELQRLFTRWDSSYHDELNNVNTTALYWDLIDLIRELMKKSLNIFTFFLQQLSLLH